MTFLRAVMILALIVWIGGIIFFSFVVAPALFTVLPTTALAGNVVSRCLTGLHWIGIFAAVVFLICSLLYSQVKFARAKPLAFVNVLVFVMLVFTLISQFAITPHMRVLRAGMQSGGVVAAAVQSEFDRLHTWSTRLEGGVLVLGIGVVFLTARRFS